MSSIMLNTETLSILSDFIASLDYLDYNYFGFSMPVSLHRLIAREKIITSKSTQKAVLDKLAFLNALASNNELPVIDQPSLKSIIKPREADSEHDYIKPWHYIITKQLDVYLYQLNESTIISDENHNSWYKALCELNSQLKDFIVCNSDLYLNAV